MIRATNETCQFGAHEFWMQEDYLFESRARYVHQHRTISWLHSMAKSASPVCSAICRHNDLHFKHRSCIVDSVREWEECTIRLSAIEWLSYSCKAWATGCCQKLAWGVVGTIMGPSFCHVWLPVAYQVLQTASVRNVCHLDTYYLTSWLIKPLFPFIVVK